MRVLVVSNAYPPHHLGGYELGCAEVVEEMRRRGHDVRVLTSTRGVGRETTEGHILRRLEIDRGGEDETPFARRALAALRKESRNQREFRRAAREFRPDVVYFWNLTGISLSLAQWAERLGLAACYYVFDLWLSHWQWDAWHSLWPPAPRNPAVRLASRVARASLGAFNLLAPRAPDLRRVQFASHYLKRATLEAGVPVEDAEVIHWGIDASKFPFREDAREPSRLLFVGQVGAHKGVHTAVEAVRIVVRERGRSEAKLTIVGGSIRPDYVAGLRRFVAEHGLEQNVEFAGGIEHGRLAEVYAAHDVLLFPSVCDEGLGIAPLEAMASGLAVLGTASGGTAEILIHDQTGLVFPKEDAAGCASHVLGLLDDQQLYEQLRRAGRRHVEENFKVTRLMDEIERSLSSLSRGAEESMK